MRKAVHTPRHVYCEEQKKTYLFRKKAEKCKTSDKTITTIITITTTNTFITPTISMFVFLVLVLLVLFMLM